MRRRTFGLSLTAAALLVVLGTTAPPRTLRYLFRSPIVLLRQIVSLIRHAGAPPLIASAAGSNPFFSLPQPTSAIFGSSNAVQSFDASTPPSRNVRSAAPATSGGSTPPPDEGSGPVEEVVGPVEEIVEPVEEVVGPIQDVLQPVEEAVEPIVDPLQEAVEPVVEPIEQAVEPIVEPIEQAVEPIVEPIEQVTEPVVGPVEPPGGINLPGSP